MIQLQLANEAETAAINESNEWLEFLNHGIQKTPYLKSVGRLKPRPKVMHVSPQRSRLNG